MAFITTDEVKEIRKELKETFPNLKFSVKKDHHSSVNVSIVKGDVDFADILRKENNSVDYAQINPYHTEFYGDKKELFEKIVCIIKTAPAKAVDGRPWYNNSDPQTDYFDTAYYISLSVGRWNKPYELRSN